MPFFCNLTSLNLGSKSVKSLKVTQTPKENTVGEGESDWDSKKVFQRQALTKYLRLTLDSM